MPNTKRGLARMAPKTFGYRAVVVRSMAVPLVTVRYSGVPVPFSDPSVGTYGFLTTSDGAIAIGEPQVAAHWYPVDDHPSGDAGELPGELPVARDQPVGCLGDAEERSLLVQTQASAEVAFGGGLERLGDALELAPDQASAHGDEPI